MPFFVLWFHLNLPPFIKVKMRWYEIEGLNKHSIMQGRCAYYRCGVFRAVLYRKMINIGKERFILHCKFQFYEY